MSVAGFLGYLVPAAISAEKTPYTFDSGDEVSVYIAGQKDLTLDVRIDETGKITLPLIGRVQISGLDAAGAEKAIVHVIEKKQILKGPEVTISVKEYRPIYVMGDVRAPGPYKFVSYATVQTAVALAGGRGLAGQTTVTEFLTASQTSRDLEQEKFVLEIRRARLEAQRDGLSTFKMARPQSPAESATFDAVFAQEKTIFETEKRNLAVQQDVLKQQRDHIKNQVAAVEKQEELEKQQLELIKDQLSRFAEMTKKGIARQNVGFELLRDETNRKILGMGLTAERARLRAQATEVETRLEDLSIRLQAKVLADHQVVTDRLRKLAVALPTARAIQKDHIRKIGTGGYYRMPVEITITRTIDGKAQALTGTMLTRLKPGDHVEIRMLTGVLDYLERSDPKKGTEDNSG